MQCSASYSGYCDGLDKLGSPGCRDHHWQAYSRRHVAACAHGLNAQFGYLGGPLHQTGKARADSGAPRSDANTKGDDVARLMPAEFAHLVG
jgi:hypothetical protein